MKHRIPVILIILSLIVAQSMAQGFLKTSGKMIVNESGNEVILRGMGLGGWMLQEGYMMQTASFAPAQHQIKQIISDLIGETDMNQFYHAWHEKHCRKIDIDSLAAWGFNCVRLPMHYNLFTLPIEEEPVQGEHTWLDRGFELTDRLLEWCAENEMYLVLDLHAAPGGQGYDKAISDYDESKPSLWESAANREKTVALWGKLAERYADEPWIGGYDLINETNWNLTGNALLKILYLDITEAIREVDTNHIIFIEGNWFANDFTGLTPPWDDNMVYSFHKYWSYNNQSSIQWVLNIRNTHNVPIWMGEAGENSNVWFADAIRLFESFDIGWAWWPMKKIGSVTGPLTIPKTDAYQTLLDYWSGQGSKPSAEFAKTALLDIADKARLENCIYRKDVIDAMFRMSKTEEAVPFKNHSIPGTIHAVDFDMGKQNKAYYDTQIADYHVSTGGDWTSWNNGGAYRNDGVDIEESKDSNGPPFSVGWIEDGEWLQYTVNVEQQDSFDVSFRVASAQSGGQLQLLVDDQIVMQQLIVPNTGGWYNWQNIEFKNIAIDEGEHRLKVKFTKGGFNFSQIKFAGDSNGIGQNGSTLPEEMYIGQNYPNPFNRSTQIPLKLPDNKKGKVFIYDQQGRIVRTLAVDGQNSVRWNGLNRQNKPSSSGIFYYRLFAGRFSETKKMLLLN